MRPVNTFKSQPIKPATCVQALPGRPFLKEQKHTITSRALVHETEAVSSSSRGQEGDEHMLSRHHAPARTLPGVQQLVEYTNLVIPAAVRDLRGHLSSSGQQVSPLAALFVGLACVVAATTRSLSRHNKAKVVDSMQRDPKPLQGLEATGSNITACAPVQAGRQQTHGSQLSQSLLQEQLHHSSYRVQHLRTELLALQQEDADWQEVHACYNGAEPVTRLRAGKLSSMQSVSAAHDERMARVSALQAQLQDEKAKLAVCKAQLQGPQHNAIGDQRALAQ